MKYLKNIGLIIVGNFLLALAVYMFIIPYDITVGGTTGLSLLGNYATGLSLSFFVLVTNLICLPLGYIFVGKELIAGSLLSSLIYPGALFIFEQFPSLQTISDNMLLSAIIGGVLSGIAVGLVMKGGGSTGGLDIPSLILKEKFHIPVGTSMLIIDISIMLCQLLFVEPNRILYGILSGYLLTYSLDKALTFGLSRYLVVIISEQYEAIRKQLLLNDFGLTLYKIKTGLFQKEGYSIHVYTKSTDIHKVKEIVEAIDPFAFMTLNNVSDIRGRGYTQEPKYEELKFDD